MQIYGILLNIRGIFTENTWKTVEKQRKIVEFPRNSFLSTYLDEPFSRSFPVISGHSRSFPVIFPIDSDWFRLIPENHSFSFLFFPFHSFSFPNTPILCSTTCFWNYFERGMKISRFFFGGSGFSSYFCRRLQDDSNLSGRATVSPMASGRRLFLCLGKSFF